MPRATYGAASGVLGSRLYVAGGKRCRRLQMWDGARWTLKADLPEPRVHAECAVHNGCLMIVGGYVCGAPDEEEDDDEEDEDEDDDEHDASRWTHAVLVYDPAPDKWRNGAPLPAWRQLGRHQVTLHEGRVLVVGGDVAEHPLYLRLDGTWAILPVPLPDEDDLSLDHSVVESVLLG